MTKLNKNSDSCCSVKYLKYSLCFYNFIFLLSGCVICGLGVWTLLEKLVFVRLMTTSTYQVTIWLLVATGCLSVITSLIGYTSIALEKRGLLALYTILLVIVFMFESCIGLIAYVYQDQLSLELTSNLGSTFIQTYGEHIENTKAIDKIQQQYDCCGSYNFTDWQNSTWYENHPDMKVPDSCCRTPTDGCGIRDHPSNIPYTGCIYRFNSSLTLHLFLVGSISLGIGLLQVIGVILTSCLFYRLDKYSSSTSPSNYNPIVNGTIYNNWQQ